MKMVLVSALMLFLSGCGPATADLLRRDSAAAHSFIVAGDVQTVYTKTLEREILLRRGGLRRHDPRPGGAGRSRQRMGQQRPYAGLRPAYAFCRRHRTDRGPRLGSDGVLCAGPAEARRLADGGVLTKDSKDCMRNRVVLDCVCYLPDADAP